MDHEDWVDTTGWTWRHWVTLFCFKLTMAGLCGTTLYVLIKFNALEYSPAYFGVGMIAVIGLLLAAVPYPSHMEANRILPQVEEMKMGRKRK